MSQGFTIDHVTPAGRLLTVFSAPDYPQFQVNQLMRPDSWGEMRVESPAAPSNVRSLQQKSAAQDEMRVPPIAMSAGRWAGEVSESRSRSGAEGP